MIVFLLQRTLQSIAVLLAVSAVAFSLFRFAGDPVNMMVAEDDTAERRATVRELLGCGAWRIRHVLSAETTGR